CSSLTEILVSADNTAYSSGDGILFNRDQTEIICYPAGKGDSSYEIPENITTIGNGAFGGCGGLVSMAIPDSVTTIGNWAFADCINLESVTIPDSVVSIGEGAFVACSSLASVVIPDSVTSINDYTFNACDSLTDVTIGDSVTTIGHVAFTGCGNLASVVIPVSVVSIGEGAFDGCDSLYDVYYGGGKPDWDAIEIGEDNDPLLRAVIHYYSTGSVYSGTYGENVTWTLDTDTGVLTISGMGKSKTFNLPVIWRTRCGNNTPK
ncbi:MAG: leucine-rich repeat domain-containing protein, partial [Clostridiales bacterium]|nr:leucine-rich repeat domain-containing protein [Clostridiales bacterium]